MRRLATLSTRGRLLLGAALTVLALASGALAFWSTTGSGSAAGSVGSLAAPSGVGAASTAGSSDVSVSWTASEPLGGVSPTGYYVRRYSGSTPSLAGGDCGTPSSPVNQTSCTDSGVADGTYTYTVVAVYHSWTAESTHSTSVTVSGDATAPTTTLTTSPESPEGSNGWFQKASVKFTLTAEDSGSGVATTHYTVDGGSTQTYSGAATVSGEGEHTLTYWSVDKASNEESHHTAKIKIDSVGPTNAISMGSPNHALLSGTTLYFNAGLAGSFTLTNAVTDATSGPASATFPAVTATNWTHAAESVSTPSGGPYKSSTYSWTSGAGTPSGAQTAVTSSDNASNSSEAPLIFVADTTTPTGGALTVNGTAASAGGTTSTATTTGFTIGTRANYAETQSASASGLASSTLTIQSATLTGNTCDAPGSGGPYTSATTIAGTTQPTIEGGYCYLYTLTGTDNVGNTTSVSTTVKVDTTKPSDAVSLSGASGAFLNGGTLYFKGNAAGEFKLVDTVTDAHTGPASASFPTLSATSWTTHTSETVSTPSGGPYTSTTFKWSAGAATPANYTVTSKDNAGNTSTGSTVTFASDTTTPTGGALTVNGTAASAGGTTSTATTTGFTIGTRANYAETQSASASGLASSTLTIQSATLTGNTCGAPGSGGPYTSATTIAGTTQPTIEGGYCYLYTLTGTDNVGNTTSVSTTVKVDTTKPSDAMSLSGASGAFLNGGTLYFKGNAAGEFKLVDTVTDAHTGPASASFPTLSATSWTTHTSETVSTPSGGPYTSTTFKWSAGAATPANYTVTSKDNAGNTSTGSTVTFASDTTTPTGGALTVNGTAASAGGSTSATAETGFAINSRTDYAETQSASQSGLAASTLTIQSATLTGNICGAPGSGGKYTTATAISGTTQPSIEGGYCYLYTLTGTDNVGNTTSIKSTVKVDTAIPSDAVSLSGASGAFLNGGTLYFKGNAAGEFKLVDTVTDAHTGPASASFPTLSATSWTTHTSETVSTPSGGPYTSTTFKWSAGAATPADYTVTSKDNAGNTSTGATVTFASDTTAPTGGSVSVPARSKTASVPVTFSAGTDGGSGINAAGGELLRAEATYTASSDTCGSFGGFTKTGSAGPTSPASDSAASGKCYEYEYRVADNVGNSTTYGPSGVVKVNTSGPALTSLSTAGGNGILETGDVLTLTFSQAILASSVPTSGTVVQGKTGTGANATLSITGLGTEWSLGTNSGYATSKTSAEFNETASVSGSTVTVTVGSKVAGTTPIAGSANTVTGTVSSSVKDLFENNASASAFSLPSTKLW